MFARSFSVLLVLLVVLAPFWQPQAQQRPRRIQPEQREGNAVAEKKYILGQMPELFTYEELVELGTVDEIRAPLKEKLNAVLTTPFISNDAFYREIRPVRPNVSGLGTSLRMVMWNIERGLRFEDVKLLLTNKDQFLKRLDQNDVKPGSDEYEEVVRQIDLLQSADVLVLQELDWGLKRTEYHEVVRELGAAMRMNWAYGVEFIEIDPINLGIEEFAEALPEDREEMRKQIAVDKQRLRCLHGNAVFSRYPILKATLQPLRVQGYNWYEGEKKRVTDLEKGKRVVSEKVFLEKIRREIRRGGRTLLTVTLDVPDLPEKQLTVAAPHLENHCKPARRQEQMREVLGYLRNIKNPLILAGDFNTSLRDDKPTSVKREVNKRVGSGEFWSKQGLKYATGVGLVFDVLAGGINFFKNQHDPTVKHVPVVAPNPEEGLFRVLENFRFDDGFCFDFRGSNDRSSNGLEGTLANSNQRAAKGFAVTYEVERTIGPVGKLKLDWIFVKPYIIDPRDPNGPYRFAPHFARTLEEVNYAVEDRISDHNPLVVDLPFSEPKLK
ncbi:MAG: endonuclease/exonuclease/phosphatase family protein [Acidobacteriota bacterium]